MKNTFVFGIHKYLIIFSILNIFRERSLKNWLFKHRASNKLQSDGIRQRQFTTVSNIHYLHRQQKFISFTTIIYYYCTSLICYVQCAVCILPSTIHYFDRQSFLNALNALSHHSHTIIVNIIIIFVNKVDDK